MLYAIVGHDAENALAIRRRVRPAHLDRARELVAEGRLLLGGPLPSIDAEDPGEAGFDGSLIVAEFPSLEAAREWIDADPYVTEGVFERVDVYPFLQVLP